MCVRVRVYTYMYTDITYNADNTAHTDRTIRIYAFID